MYIGLTKNEYQRLWRLKNPDYVRQWTKKKREASHVRLAGRPKPAACEVCGRTNKRIHYDHSHLTGEFRGWICLGCNIAVGQMEDNPEFLRKLADYLERSAPAVEN
jgi:hypothetical protein